MAAVLDDRVETVTVIVLAIVHETSGGRIVRSEEVRSRGEPTAFVELRVGREVDLRHDAFDASVAQYDGAVVETPPETYGCSDHHRDVFASCEVHDPAYRLLRLGQQEILAEEVKAGVACYRKFRKHDERCPFFLGLAGKVAD